MILRQKVRKFLLKASGRQVQIRYTSEEDLQNQISALMDKARERKAEPIKKLKEKWKKN